MGEMDEMEGRARSWAVEQALWQQRGWVEWSRLDG